MNATYRGIGYILLGMISFALMNAGVKSLQNEEPVSVLLFFRFFLSTLLILPFIYRERGHFFHVARPGLLLSRVIFALLSIMLAFFAVRYTSLSNAALLTGTTPLFVPLFLGLFMHQKTPLIVWASLLIGYLGIIVVLHPAHLDALNRGSLMALASGIFASIVYVVIRMLSHTMSVVKMLAYYYIVCTIVTGLFAFEQWQPVTSLAQWGIILGVAFLGYTYQLGVNMAMVVASPEVVSPFLFSGVIFAGIIDWLGWHHVPDKSFLAGSVLIVISTVATVRFTHYYNKKRELAKKQITIVTTPGS